MDGNERVAAFIRELDWEGLPEAVRYRARACLLDGLGSVLAGTLAPISRISANYAAEAWRGDEATILGRGLRANAAGAAFANGNAGNALDIDDDQLYTRGHPGVVIIPTAFAVAEKVDAGGKALLEALVVGYEVAPRVGYIQHAGGGTYRADGSWGAVTAAAVAARLLDLGPAEIRHALGIAEYHAPYAPMMRDIASPSMVKHGIGWGAMTGVAAAELAARGYTGIPSLLADSAFEDRVADIGQRYLLPESVSYKEWASCAWGHAPGVAALDLVRQHHIDVDDIAALRIYSFEEAVALHQGYPATTEEAQFSVVWPVAALLIDGEIGPEQVLEERFQDPEIRSLVDRIEMIRDPAMDELYLAGREEDVLMHARVEIELTDGRVLDSGIVERGATSAEWPMATLEAKFRWLVGHVYNEALVEDLIAAVRRFETIESVRAFTATIS